MPAPQGEQLTWAQIAWLCAGTKSLWFVRVMTIIYFALMDIMLLSPNPWALFGFHRLYRQLEGVFSILHVLIFMALAVGVEIGRVRFPRIIWLVLLLCFGPATEVLQHFTGRAFELVDVLEDTVGVLLGFLFGFLFCRIKLVKNTLGKA